MKFKTCCELCIELNRTLMIIWWTYNHTRTKGLGTNPTKYTINRFFSVTQLKKPCYLLTTHCISPHPPPITLYWGGSPSPHYIVLRWLNLPPLHCTEVAHPPPITLYWGRSTSPHYIVLRWRSVIHPSQKYKDIWNSNLSQPFCPWLIK